MSAPERAPRCRHFGACGGCQLQHLTPQTQLQSKADHVHSLLQTAGVPVPCMQIHSADEYEYRNRIRLRVENSRVGYSIRASNGFLPIDECPIAAPILWRAANELRNLNRWPHRSTEVEIFTDADQSALQILLHVDSTVASLDRDAPRQFRAMCSELLASIPQVTGGGLLVQGELASGSRRVQERQRVEVVRWGAPSLDYTVGGFRHIVSRGAFFQVNRFLTSRMVELVLRGRTGAVVWDLFAGVGLFSIPLAQRFAQVIAVEIGQPAASDVAKALACAGRPHQAIARPVLDFLRAQHGVPPDLIVMDPPRAGLGSAVAQQLVRLGAPELVYISCDAATFARDARALVDSRYAVTELYLLDLFPQTKHTETIAVFRRK